MWLGKTNNQITRTKDGKWWYKFGDEEWTSVDESSDEGSLVKEIYQVFRKSNMSDEEKFSVLKINSDLLHRDPSSGTGRKYSSSDLKNLCHKLISFFSEFYFEPNFRFVNTFALISKDATRNVKDYVASYFELSNSQYASSIEEKMRSQEFAEIVAEMKKIPTETKVNKRFKVYYGSQGTGKTTRACQESEGRVINCHSGVLPQDLMEDFDFTEGKAEFRPSALYKAMEEGKSIVLDEINLLPYDSIRFLQSILDDKKEFIYKGRTVKISEGFKIIGTMNLVVNGCVYSLPEPLIDRAEDLVKFKLSASDLAEALI